MTATNISICSNALILLGDTAISSFTDGTTGSDVSAALYDTTLESMLTETLWHFATKVVDAAKLADKPTNNWSNQFQLPSDVLYLVKTDTRNYEIYEDKIYTNANTLQLEYIYKVGEHAMPSYFIKALEYHLAAQFAIPITGNTTRAEEYRKMYEMQIRRARNADSTQRPNIPILDDPYIQVRFN